MKPVQFDYKRPATIHEACRFLAADSDARILAGGQSLIPMLSMRLSRPSVLVDIAHIPELTELVETEDFVQFGSMVRQVKAEKNYIVKNYIPLLAKALCYVGHPPTRARGTIGGSIAHADPSAEIALVAVTLNAKITYQDDDGEVVFDARDFFIGPMLTLAPSSGCLTNVRFPKAAPVCGTGFHEVAPRRSDYALASAAAQINADCEGKIETIHLGVGSVSDFPFSLDVDELLNVGLDDEDIRSVVHIAIDELEIFGDLHASAAYRRRVGTELAIRALRDARDEINKRLSQ